MQSRSMEPIPDHDRQADKMSQVIVFCEHYRAELEKLALNTRYDNLEVTFFPARCGMPPTEWTELRDSLDDDLENKTLHIISSGCIANLPEKDQKVFQQYNFRLSQCLHTIVNPELADYYIKQGYYLVTPGWLRRWRDILAGWGLKQDMAQSFFHDTAKAVLLLDTGVDDKALVNLKDFSSYINLPAESVNIGLDYLELLLNNTVLKSRLEDSANCEMEVAMNDKKNLADFVMTLDLLNSLARIRSEEEVIASIKDMFTMLFAPKEVALNAVDEQLLESGHLVERINTDSFSMIVTGTEKALGTIEVRGLELPEHREHYINIAKKIINICGMAIENARHYQQIKDVSDTDGLTGLANRRKLEEHLGKEWRRMLRSSSPLTLMMVDIDYFKNYNDYYGHLAGDDCLKKVANQLKGFCRRPGDLAARFGGEEFTLVFPDTDPERASYLAEKVRKAVESLKIRHEDSEAGGYVTISIGVVSRVPDANSSSTDLVSEADHNLYKAKEAGRNICIIQ